MAKGFFNIEEVIQPTSYIPTTLSKYNIAGEPDCLHCGLDKKGQCRHPKIAPTGNGVRKILVIAEAPGNTEDEKGQNLVGDAGKLLTKILRGVGVELHRDCLIINSVNCHPPGNRTPTSDELLCCRPYLLKTIEEFKPQHIWLFGGSAVDTYLDGMFGTRTIGRWAGLTFPDPRNGAWVSCHYHPSYVLRNERDEHLKATNLRYLKKSVQELSRSPFTFKNYDDQVMELVEYKRVMFLLDRVLRTLRPITIDYETTGIKPYKQGHKVYCVSMDDGEKSYVFPLQRPNFWTSDQYERIISTYREVLEEERIKKTAHNVSFENNWSEVVLDAKVRGWDWCTMNTAHLIDSRAKYTGLKFQSFLHFGIKGYEDEMGPYIKAKEKGQEFNQIHLAPMHGLHHYCGLDTVFTRELRKVQEKILSTSLPLQRAQQFTMEGLEVTNAIQNRGIGADREYFEAERERLTKKITGLEEAIQNSEEAEDFVKKTGKRFNYKSSSHVRTLFFDHLKFPALKFTNTSESTESTDQEVLTKLNHPLASTIIRCKKLYKTRNTYLAQFFREITEKGRIHPIQNLHLASTFRSSQDHPNAQNIPVRDEESKKSCRSGIVARKGMRIVEKDYGSQEVRIIACYSQDQVLVDYILDNTTDMHRDEAAGIFILPEDRVSKDIRFYAKNCWVFPQFYRSWYKSCSRDLWKNVVMPDLKTKDGEPITEHLKSKGVYSELQFEEHCRRVEKVFWDKYRGVRKWQDKVLKTYLEKGVVETFFGHKREGLLSANEVVNSPIQGTAFHCLLWTAKEAKKVIERKKYESGLINQIHDSLVSEVLPSEQMSYIEDIRYIAEDKIKKEHKWMIVPLVLEIEMCPVNGNWYQKEEVRLHNGKWCSFDKKGTIKNIYDEGY